MKAQELGNTGKKRAPSREEVEDVQHVVDLPTRSARAGGDPTKIAQYFPELI